MGALTSLLSLKTDTALAIKLHMSRQGLRRYKKEGKIPYPHLIHLCQELGISMEWLFFANGPAYVDFQKSRKLFKRLLKQYGFEPGKQ